MASRDRTPGVRGLRTGTLSRAERNEFLKAEERREAFIEATAEQMFEDDWQKGWGVEDKLGEKENLMSWLRTVWLEARGEEWGDEQA